MVCSVRIRVTGILGIMHIRNFCLDWWWILRSYILVEYGSPLCKNRDIRHFNYFFWWQWNPQPKLRSDIRACKTYRKSKPHYTWNMCNRFHLVVVVGHWDLWFLILKNIIPPLVHLGDPIFQLLLCWKSDASCVAGGTRRQIFLALIILFNK